MEKKFEVSGEKSCSLQFTGGRDSTLTAIQLIEKYHMENIHLLTFQTDLMTDVDKVYKNVMKLKECFEGKARVEHHLLDTNQLLMDLVQKNYFHDLFQFKTYNAATFCPSCRLSHHANTVIFCKKHSIGHAADGVNELTGFDLFQQEWAVEMIRELYEEYGIIYHTPLLHQKTSSEILLEEYNHKNCLEKPFYEEQPRCIGGGQFHNLYLRCYYLPLKGKQAYIEVSKKWIAKKIPFVRQYIEHELKELL
mgnify:CR=1 FL=1